MYDNTYCQTPGTIYHTHITSRYVEVRANVTLELSEKEAQELELVLHLAMESALAKYFK